MNGNASRNQVTFTGAGTLNIGGNITGGDLVRANNCIVNYNGTSAQTVAINSDYQYYHLYINNTSTSGATLQGTITTTNVTGDLRIQSGILNNGGFAIAGAEADDFEVANGATFILTGTSSMATGFTKTFGLTSTVDYAGGNQTISPENYGHLTVSAGSKTIAADAVVYVYGNLINSGTITMTAGTSTVNTWLRMYENVTNNPGATIDATALYTRFIFPGTNAQTFINNGIMTSPVASFDVANSHTSGLTLLGSNGINATRVNLFYGLVTNSNMITLGSGGTSYAVVQRGVASNTYPAGSFNVNPTFNMGTGGLILLYDDGSVAYNTGYEVPSSLSCDLFYIFDGADVSLNSDLTINEELNFYGGTGTPTLRIGAHTLTLGGTITYTVAGAFYGGTSANLIMDGATTLNSVINGLNDFTINNNTTLGGAVTVNGTLYLTNGLLNNGSNLSMATGTTIDRSDGSLSNAPTFGASVNVVYTGSSSITTGYEIPASSTVLNNLTTNTGGVIQGSSYSSPTNLLTDAFPNLTSWTGDKGSGNNQYSSVASNNAGGTANECRYLYGSSQTTIYTASIYRSVNTAGYAALNIQWKQFIDNFDATSLPYTISVQCATSSSGPWTDIYSLSPSGTANIGPETKTFNNWTTNVGGNFYIRFYITGYTYGLDYWYFDDLIINGTTLVPSATTVNGTLDLTNGTYTIGSNTLALNGGLSGNNVFIGGTSSNLEVSGTGANLVLPTITNGLNDFTITRSNGASIASTKSLTVTGTLNNTIGNAGLLIKADNSGNMGSLIHNTANVPATVEQYLSSERWHLVSPPISDATINVYFDIYLKEYNESDDTWTNLELPTTIPMDETQGYYAWIDDSWPPPSSTVSFKGQLNSGDYNLSGFGFSPSTNPGFYGFNLVGNPYPCALDWNTDSSWNRVNMSGWMVIKENTTYRGWNPFLPGNESWNSKANGIIPSTQGFWVRATGSGASITIPSSQREHNGQTFYKSTIENPYPTVRLNVECGVTSDETVVIFHPEGHTGFDGLYDLGKFSNGEGSPDIYTVVEENEYAVNIMPEEYTDEVIPVNFKIGIPGTYQVHTTEVVNFTNGINVYLQDLKTGTVAILEENTVYEFDYSPLDESHRFNLHFKDSYFGTKEEFGLDGILIYAFDDVINISLEKGNSADVTIYDLMGREMLKQKITNEKLTQIKLDAETGYYLVKVQTGEQFITQKVFVK
jgi:hypothetical protein